MKAEVAELAGASQVKVDRKLRQARYRRVVRGQVTSYAVRHMQVTAEALSQLLFDAYLQPALRSARTSGTCRARSPRPDPRGFLARHPAENPSHSAPNLDVLLFVDALDDLIAPFGCTWPLPATGSMKWKANDGGTPSVSVRSTAGVVARQPAPPRGSMQ